MKSTKEHKEAPSAEQILVLERLVGMTRVIRKGNDPKLAEAAAKVEQRLNEMKEEPLGQAA